MGEGAEARRRRALPRERLRPHGHRADPLLDRRVARKLDRHVAVGMDRHRRPRCCSSLVALHDLTQKRHAILRNFPIVGHFRYWLEALGPELRQYIVTQQRRGAAVHARPAALGLRVGEEGEQLLRLRHRQRPRASPATSSSATARSRCTRRTRRARLRSDVPAALRAACSAATAAASTRSARARSSTCRR